MKLIHSILIFGGILAMNACADKETTNILTSSSCLASQFEISNKIDQNYESSNSVFVNFDVKNNSKTDYDPVKNPLKQGFIYLESRVTCTDGSVYDETSPLTVVELKAGSTAAALSNTRYGVGKTFKNIDLKLVCK